eukprot:COSAG05_NODE_1086_length_5923_cov_254.414492_1_plen_409_part_00
MQLLLRKFLAICIGAAECTSEAPTWDPSAPDAPPRPRPLTFPAAGGLRVRRGLYSEPVPGWAAKYSNVVLVTAGNFAYRDMLANWECAAASLGLQWVVVALDQELYDFLGPERAVMTSGEVLSGTQHFETDGFNVISCNKLHAVRSFLREGADVVFSDPDNIFLKDPFRPGEELGLMIRQGIDYVYTANLPGKFMWPDDRMVAKHFSDAAAKAYGWTTGERGLMICSTGDIEDEGNTGLHYMRAAAEHSVPLFDSAIGRCVAHPEKDDQTNFWIELHKIKISHCTKMYRDDGSVQLEMPHKPGYMSTCCLDPRTYIAGGRVAKTDPSVVAYHANWVTGKPKKILKLKNDAPQPGIWFLEAGEGTDADARHMTEYRLDSCNSHGLRSMDEPSNLEAMTANRNVRKAAVT